jgi:hypothetical protein
MQEDDSQFLNCQIQEIDQKHSLQSLFHELEEMKNRPLQEISVVQNQFEEKTSYCNSIQLIGLRNKMVDNYKSLNEKA